MHKRRNSKTEPESVRHQRAHVTVVLEIGTPISALAAAKSIPALKTRLTSELNNLIATLGLKKKPHVAVQSVVSQRTLRLRVNGAIHPYDAELMRRVWTAIAPVDQRQVPYAEAEVGGGFPDAWLAAYIKKSGVSDNKSLGIIFEFMSRLVTDAIAQRPSSLVTEDEGDAYVEALQARSSSTQATASAKDLTDVIKGVVDLGISLTDKTRLVDILGLAQQHGLSVEDTIEFVFTQFRSQRIEIHAHPEYIKNVLNLTAFPSDSNSDGSAVSPVRQLFHNLLGRLTQQHSTHQAFTVYSEPVSASVQGLFRAMEEEVFMQCGLHTPDIVLVSSPQMQQGFVSLKINDWMSTPILGLQAGEVFIHEAPEFFARLGKSATPALNPHTGQRGSVVTENQTITQSEGQGLRTGPIEFLTSIISRELLANAHRLFGVEDTEYQLALLKPSFGRLIQVATSRFSIGDITRVIRRLLLERLSFRNTWVILEKLLQFDTVPVSSIDQIILDERLPVLTQNGNMQLSTSAAYQEFVRAAYKNYISYKYRQSSGRINAIYLAGTDQFSRFTSYSSQLDDDLDENSIEKLKDALWSEMEKTGAGAPPPILVTSPLIRRAVRDLIAEELRGLPVIAYSEIRPEELNAVATIPLQKPTDSHSNEMAGITVESAQSTAIS